MSGLIEVPDDFADVMSWEGHQSWPWVTDRDSELWAVSPYRWQGELVLLPFAGDMRPAPRSSVEATYGPLADEPHCPICGTTLFWRDGECALRLDTLKHPR